MKVTQKIQASIELIRPELPIAAGICVVVGQTIALGKFAPLPTILQGFALGFFLSSSAMIFNDYFDIEVDRVNSPHRPLPSGRITKTEATVLGISTALIAQGIAISIALVAFLGGLILWALGFLYNWKWKSNGLLGNLVVSLNVAMTFLFGAFSVDQIHNPAVWMVALIAFFFDLAEEIAGDAMDLEGDLKRGSRSLAIRFGKKTALRISALMFATMVLLTLVPIIFSHPPLAYILPIAALDIIIVVFTRKLLISQTPQAGRGAMRVMYLAATLCLVIYIIWLNINH
jgi:geranylgeranylglycerol-phosphate geranylgeranyltransferase